MKQDLRNIRDCNISIASLINLYLLKRNLFKLKTPQQSVSPEAACEEAVAKHNTGIR